MSQTTTALLLGLAAGLGVAMPLGAIGVLLLRTGMIDGWRAASAGALGVALVDVGYATVAVLAGTAVSTALAGHERQVRLLGAAVLAAIAVTGLARQLRHRGASRGVAGPGTAHPVARPGRVLLRFVALTSVNPLTAVYFAVLAAGLAAALAGPAQRLAFVLGIGAASATWQLGLAAVGSLAARGVGARGRALVGVVGDLVVLALAAVVALA